MAFHGYDPGNPNNWYQSRSDMREPAAEYGGNYHGSHNHSYSPSLHLHQFLNPLPWASSPNPVSEMYPYPSFYHHSSPPIPNHTIINGHSLPLQFPFSSSISQPMNPQPSPPTYYPPSQSYNPYVCLPTQQFHSVPSISPTKTTTTPPIYQSNPISHGMVIPSDPQPQFSDPKPQTPLLSVVSFEPSSASLENLGHQLEVPAAATDGIDHSSPALLGDPIPNLADITTVDVIVDGEIELQSVGTLNQKMKMQFPAMNDEKLATHSDKLHFVHTLSPWERGFDATYKGDTDRDPRRNSDEKIQSKGGGGIVDLPLVMDSDNCVIKVYDRYDTLYNIELDEFCKEFELGIRIWTVRVYQYCKLGQFDRAKRLLCEVIKLCFTPTPIVGNASLNSYNSGQENLSAGDRFESFKVDSDLVLARIWLRWKSEVAAGNTLEVGDNELDVEFINKTMVCLENILGCNIDLTNDKDAIWSAQYQIVCSSLPTAWVLPTQSSCHNMRRIIESHFRCPNLYDIGIYEVVTKVTIFGAIDYSSSRFILVSQNLFQVTVSNAKSKYALLRLHFTMSSVTLKLLFVESDKSESMFVDNATKALGDALLECNHWIVEWAKEKPGWEELLTFDSKFNQYVLVIRNVIAHVQFNAKTLLDEMGHTRVLGLHIFLDEVHVRFLGLDLAIKYENHHGLSNKHFCLVLRYAITSIPKCRAFFKDFVILFSELGLVEIQNHNFSSSESRIIQCIMWISVIMEFEDNIATTIQEVTSLRFLIVHLVLVLFALLKCHLGVKLETARHDSFILKFMKAMILYCCVWLNLLQLVGFFFNGDGHWNVLQKFMEFKIMILGKDTTSELTVRQDAVVENLQRYLGKLNARYVALLQLREVISFEEFGQTVSFGVSSEELLDFPKTISDSYAFWVFKVDKEVVLATLGVIQVMYLLPLDHQKELHEQVVAKKEVSDFQGLLLVHCLLKGCSQIGFDGNYEREENAQFSLHNVHLFVAPCCLRVTIIGMWYTIVVDALSDVCLLINGESNSIDISWKSQLNGNSMPSIATQASAAVLLQTSVGFLSWILSSCFYKYNSTLLTVVFVAASKQNFISNAMHNLFVSYKMMVQKLLDEANTRHVSIAWTLESADIITRPVKMFNEERGHFTATSNLDNITIIVEPPQSYCQSRNTFSNVDMGKMTLFHSSDDKLSVHEATTMTRLVANEDDSFHYFLPWGITMTRLVANEDNSFHYFLPWGITSFIFYFGFVSPLSIYGCFWYNILGAAFDNRMTLKLLNIVDSAHGTSLKTRPEFPRHEDMP